MKEELSHNEFEKRLKDSADKFVLQPSDEVWKRIKEELHPRRRVYMWWWTAAGVLLLVALGIYMLQPSGSVSQQQRIPMVAGSPAPSGGTSEKKATSPSGKEKIHPKEKKDTATVTVKRKATNPAPSSASYNQASYGATRRKSHVINRTGSNISLRPASPMQMKLPALPVLPRLQPNFSIAFHADFVDHKPYYSANVAKKSSWGLITLQSGNPSLAKKHAPTGLKKQIKKKPSWEISFTPAIGYRVLKITTPQGMMADANSAVGQSSFNQSSYGASGQMGIRQHPDYGWAASARISLPLGKQWFFQSGISLSKTGYSILAYDTYPATIRNNGMTSFAGRGTNSFYTVNSVGAAALKLSYMHSRYVAAGIPVLIGRQFGHPDKVSFSVRAGVGIFYLVGSDPVIYSPDSKRYFTDNKYVNPFNGNLHLETTIHIPLNHKFQIIVGPSLQYQIFSSYKNYSQVKEHPYLLGIKTGLLLR